MPESDQRGRHTTQPGRVSEELHQQVREHIMSFPARQSHYSRHANPGLMYLSPNLSIARTYQLFLAKYDPEYVEYMEGRREALITMIQLIVMKKESQLCQSTIIMTSV